MLEPREKIEPTISGLTLFASPLRRRVYVIVRFVVGARIAYAAEEQYFGRLFLDAPGFSANLLAPTFEHWKFQNDRHRKLRDFLFATAGFAFRFPPDADINRFLVNDS
jgi:hypothetical protein